MPLFFIHKASSICAAKAFFSLLMLMLAIRFSLQKIFCFTGWLAGCCVTLSSAFEGKRDEKSKRRRSS